MTPLRPSRSLNTRLLGIRIPRLRRVLAIGAGSAVLLSGVLPAQALPRSEATSARVLPGSFRSSFFVFKLASSLQLSDTQTPQCDAANAGWQRAAKVMETGSTAAEPTVSHSFVLPQTTAALRTLLDEYAQNYSFTPLGSWSLEAGNASRSFSDAGAQGYRYAVNLYPLGGGGTALCFNILGLQ